MKSTKVTSFGRRLKEAFGNAANKEIARQLGISNAAVTAYIHGRIPPAHALILISQLTGCSIHWLVTGVGNKEAEVPRARARASTRVIVLANSAGGEAKSTSAAMLAAEFARRRHRTLLIDSPGGSCAVALFPALISSYHFRELPRRKYELFTFEGRGFFRTRIKHLDLCSRVGHHQQILKSAGVASFTPDISTLNRKYEFVVIDSDVGGVYSFVELLLASLVAPVHVLIPTSGTPLGLYGVEQTLEILRTAQRSLSGVNILGTFVTRYDLRKAKLSEIWASLEDLLPRRVLNTVVRRDTSLAEFDGYGIRRLTRERSRGAADYAALADEILNLIS